MMVLTRRQWGAGAGATLAALGLGRAGMQGLLGNGWSPGLKPWADWRDDRYQGPLALIAAGVLAASPHNTQPWRFAVGRFGVDIFDVPQRHLGAMDPLGRERRAGLGAAIHNMALASTRLGRPGRVRLLPDPGNPLHMARVELGPDGMGPPPHPLVPVIARRHTHRGAWTGAPITAEQRQALLAFPRPDAIRLVLFDAQGAEGQRFARLTEDATAAIVADAAMLGASHRWFRHEKREADQLRDGLTLRTSGLDALTLVAGSLLPQPDAATEGRYWLAATRDTQLPSASLFGLILAHDPADVRQALLTGMAWQRLHLVATALGLVAQPLNQLPEMIDRERQLGQAPRFATAAAPLLAGQLPAFAFRLGQAMAPAPASQRRAVSTVLGPPARLAFEVEEWRRAESAF
jgi:nitroreductase